MNLKSKSIVRGAILAAALTSSLAFADQASAADYFVSDNCLVNTNPDCTTGTNVLYVFYNSVDSNGYTDSARAKFLGNVPDYAGAGVNIHYIFSGNSGNGVAVKNNAASVLGCSSQANYRVYLYSNYGGHSQYISGNYGCSRGVNLDSQLHNDNASQAWA
ncbi:hypothetical protein [Kitasatospora purpeofusca]|uniref:hypothetical protein n=1 Tax=Kitasatospora purpeofusca TaxID=67352 RepID=UPI002A5A734F|nr:hypothetical protein [Kitasatospora purpeofusca]MDY0810711.1 hypothetical protein [Kitasatospora purpeofusca]